MENAVEMEMEVWSQKLTQKADRYGCLATERKENTFLT